MPGDYSAARTRRALAEAALREMEVKRRSESVAGPAWTAVVQILKLVGHNFANAAVHECYRMGAGFPSDHDMLAAGKTMRNAMAFEASNALAGLAQFGCPAGLLPEYKQASPPRKWSYAKGGKTCRCGCDSTMYVAAERGPEGAP